MGTAARNLLWRISPLFWLTAVSLVVVHDADPAFQQIGWVVVTTGLGAAGSRAVFEFYEKRNGYPLWLDPGEILVISNPAAIDAALTWQLTVNVDYRQRDTV